MTLEASDAELVRSIRAGEGAEHAEAALYHRFSRRIELYGLRHLSTCEAAKDLVQEVLSRVLTALRAGRLEDPERLASFVLGTCRNLSSELRRSDRRQAALARAGALMDEVVLPTTLEERDVVRLMGCLSALPEREATVVRMSFWEDRDAQAIGARIGASAGNVRVIRHRAVARLAGCMNAAGL